MEIATILLVFGSVCLLKYDGWQADESLVRINYVGGGICLAVWFAGNIAVRVLING